MNRLAVRRAERYAQLSREERGLPKHPAWGWIDCSDCHGAGCIETYRHSADYYPNTFMCGGCDGVGRVWDSPMPHDPLITLRAARQLRSIRPSDYRMARNRAMRPVHLPEYVAPAMFYRRAA